MKAKLKRFCTENKHVLQLDDYEILFSYERACVLKNLRTEEIGINKNYSTFSTTTKRHINMYLNTNHISIMNCIADNIYTYIDLDGGYDELK